MSNELQDLPLLLKLTRSLIAGIITVVIETLTFVLLINLTQLSPVVANPIAFCLGVAVNFILSRMWVFARSGQQLHKEMMQFGVVALIGLLGDFSIFWVLFKMMHHALSAKLITIVVMFGLNFVLKQAVFAHPEARKSIARLQRLYRSLPFSARMYTFIRWHSCPLERVVAELPQSGTLLDYGCGVGLVSAWAMLTRPNLRATGVDIDERKIADAHIALANWPHGPAPEMQVIAPGEVPKGKWDAIVIVDVLYLITEDDRRTLLQTLVSRLQPGGLFIIKGMSERPRWKFKWGLFQEWLAVKVVGITKHAELPTEFPTIEKLQTFLAKEGMSVRVKSVHQGYPHSHALLVAKKSI
jgi:putative flippase GtrA/2-polyprenyl-3-methyl-5-hydroxy-6-metoxy-1,4-benzoquinol methylase